MANCERYQSQLLSFLYELLEADEQRALREHLDQCDACKGALARAEQQKKLLATAAKAEFPGVRFQPPPVGESVRREETPAAGLRTSRRAWLGWAIAASVLLLAGAGVPATIWSWRYSTSLQYAQMLTAEYHAKRAQFQHEFATTLPRKRQEFADLQDQIRKVTERQQQQWAA